MAITEVRSPNNTTPDHPRRGESPGAYSNPGNPRNPRYADQGQGPHSAGKGWLPLDLRDPEGGPIPPTSDSRR